MTLSQSFQPMAVQLSMKAALPLVKSLVTVSHRFDGTPEGIIINSTVCFLSARCGRMETCVSDHKWCPDICNYRVQCVCPGAGVTLGKDSGKAHRWGGGGGGGGGGKRRTQWRGINTLKPGKIAIFADDIFHCIWMKTIELGLKFHWNLILGFQLTLRLNVQVMAWCHYLNQCWPRSRRHMAPPRSQWVKHLW